MLQFDGHGNDAGYMTRCEAYLDSKGILRCYQRQSQPRHPLAAEAHLHSAHGRGSARAFASAFRAIGLDAEPTPPSDHLTRELGARYTSGDECYPAKVTVGDFMKLLRAAGDRSLRVALFMPTAEGPCRFGQYAPYLRQVLNANGYAACRDPFAHQQQRLCRHWARWPSRSCAPAWRALLCADLLEKLLLIHRPYEERRGSSEEVYEESLNDLCVTLESTPVEPGVQLQALRDSLVRSRDRFRRLGARRDRNQPLIGIVGEIFCRLNTFSNENLVRSLEEYGAEAWVSDIVEWIWYTNSEHFRKLELAGRKWSLEAFGAWVRTRVQKRDEHVLVEPFAEDFRGREEPGHLRDPGMRATLPAA